MSFENQWRQGTIVMRFR